MNITIIYDIGNDKFSFDTVGQTLHDLPAKLNVDEVRVGPVTVYQDGRWEEIRLSNQPDALYGFTWDTGTIQDDKVRQWWAHGVIDDKYRDVVVLPITIGDAYISGERTDITISRS